MDCQVTEVHLVEIARFLPKWKAVTKKLGVERELLKDIEDHYHDREDQRYEALTKWVIIKGSQATYKNLYEVLREMKLVEAAEKVLELTREQPRAPAPPQNPSDAHPPPSDVQLLRSDTHTPHLSDVTDQKSTLVQCCDPAALEKSIMQLNEQFLNVVQAIQVDCEDVSIDEIKTFVTHIVAVLRGGRISYLMERDEAIAKATSIIEIITSLNVYWNWYNYDLLENLVMKYGTEQTKQLMKQFVGRVTAFNKVTTLADIKCIWRGEEVVPPGFCELTVHLGLNPEHTTFDRLYEFIKHFCQQYFLNNMALNLRRILFGSVVVVWLIPSHVAEHLCAEIKNPDVTCKVLTRYNVLEVVISGVSVFVCASGQDEDNEQDKIREAESIDANLLEEKSVWLVPSCQEEQLVSKIKMHEDSGVFNITGLQLGKYEYSRSEPKELGMDSDYIKSIGDNKEGSDATTKPTTDTVEAILDKHIIFADKPPLDLLDKSGSVILHPYRTTCCGYLIEKEASQLLRNCPCCGNHIEAIYYDRSLHEKVKALQVHCKCGRWTGNLGDLNKHVKNCSHAFTDCPNLCGQKVQKRRLEMHKDNDCSKNSHLCNTTSTYEDDITKDHLPQCAEKVVPSPNESENVHTSTSTLKCEFSLVGCKYQCETQQLMNDHLTSENSNHDKMALQFIKEKESKIQNLTEYNQTLKTQYFRNVQIYSIPEFMTDNIWNQESWLSEPFYSQQCSYKMFITLSGYDPDNPDLIVSIHVNEEHNKELNCPFLGNITLELVDHSGTFHQHQVDYTFDQRINQGNSCSRNFISYDELVFNTQGYQYLKDNQITLRVVDITVKSRMVSTTSTGVQQQEKSLLEKCKQMLHEQAELLEQQNALLKSIVLKPSQIFIYAKYPEFIMENFTHYLKSAKTWFSEGFYTQPGGYKLCLEVNAAGTGKWSGEKISIGLHLMKGDYDDELLFPFCGEIAIQLVDQMVKNHVTKIIFFDNSQKAGTKTTEDMNLESCDIPDFVAVGDIKQNDKALFRVVNVVNKTPVIDQRHMGTTDEVQDDQGKYFYM